VETARDVVEDFLIASTDELPPHPLEHHMFPPSKWPQKGLADTCKKFLYMMEVYVDDYNTMVHTMDATVLWWVSRLLMKEIHKIFPPPAISGLDGVDPISLKKTIKMIETLGCEEENTGVGV